MSGTEPTFAERVSQWWREQQSPAPAIPTRPVPVMEQHEAPDDMLPLCRVGNRVNQRHEFGLRGVCALCGLDRPELSFLASKITRTL